MNFLKKELEDIEKMHRYRFLRPVSLKQGPEIVVDGKRLINFSSNDYLGFSQHPWVKRSAVEAIRKFGVGAQASRLLSGHTPIHEELEEGIARLKGTEKALVFSTGYMANLGAISALMGPRDLIILDRLNHASLVDAAFLSKAKIWIYPHRDIERLEALLKRGYMKDFRHKWVITESLFSMDGDIAPLAEILSICKKHRAFLMIDEAHATGTLGTAGRGALEHFSINPHEVEMVMGTLSKALGSMGGFIAGKEELIEYLKNKARSFIYTTGLPPGDCAASLRAIKILEGDRSWVERLRKNIEYFLDGFKKMGMENSLDFTPIIPWMVGSDQETLAAARLLEERGIFAPAIRPPTVPEGEGRIRFSLMATHKKEHLDQALEALGKLRKFL